MPKCMMSVRLSAFIINPHDWFKFLSACGRHKRLAFYVGLVLKEQQHCKGPPDYRYVGKDN
jgi:hypothetical protein